MNKKMAAMIAAAVIVLNSVSTVAFAETYSETVSKFGVTSAGQSAAEFLESYIPAQTNAVIYSTGDSHLNVNGRIYNYGVKLSDGGMVTYNTTGISKLTFEVAHFDNSAWDNETLNIIYDGEVYNSIALTPSMANKKIELDVSNVDMLTLSLSRKYNNCQYAMVNFTVDGDSSTMGYEVPTYSSIDDITGNIFNTRNMSYYDTSKKLGYKVNGRSYFNGIFLNSNGAFSLNVENMKSISFELGQLDNSGFDNTELYVYYDGELFDTVKVGFNQKITSKTYDLTNVDVLRIVRKSDYSKVVYCLSDIVTDSVIPERPYMVPDYNNDAIAFMNSAYNTTNIKIYDNTTKLGYDMGGQNFNQGIIMYDGSNFTVNTEKLNTISFTLGHLDNSAARDAKLNIYYDDELSQTIDLVASKKPYQVTLDVSKVDNVYFLLKKTYYNQTFGLADVTISSAEAIKSDGIKGDINGDGKINVQDVSKLAAHIKGVKKISEDVDTDMNGDGKNNVTDLSLLAAHVKGIKKLN